LLGYVAQLLVLALRLNASSFCGFDFLTRCDWRTTSNLKAERCDGSTPRACLADHQLTTTCVWRGARDLLLRVTDCWSSVVSRSVRVRLHDDAIVRQVDNLALECSIWERFLERGDAFGNVHVVL
jgi:hypothetical protein